VAPSITNLAFCGSKKTPEESRMNKKNCSVALAHFVCALALLAAPAAAQTDAGTLQQADVAHDEADYSPFVDRHVPDRVLWGDTHLHTSYSFDAGFFGNTLAPDMAYRFARGEEVTSSTGVRVKLIRPLDFLVVADHAEYFGMSDMMAKGDPVLQEDPVTARWYKLRQGSQEDGMKAFYEGVESVTSNENLVKNPAMQRTAWDTTLEISERFNDPGKFSAFIGYEWSSSPSGNNLHRVVMFRDGADRAGQIVVPGWCGPRGADRPLQLFRLAGPRGSLGVPAGLRGQDGWSGHVLCPQR
jgi:hypothetical protein